MKNIIFSLCLFVLFMSFYGCSGTPLLYTRISGIPSVGSPSLTVVNGGTEDIVRVVLNDIVYDYIIKKTEVFAVPINGYGDYFSVNSVLITKSGRVSNLKPFYFSPYNGQRKQTWVVTQNDFPQR